MLLIGLACSTALIVARALHFTDSNRLHRRIKMQSLDIDHEESTPLAKLMRQCIWIDAAPPRHHHLLAKASFSTSSSSEPAPAIQGKVLIWAHLFQSISLKFIMEYQWQNSQESHYCAGAVQLGDQEAWARLSCLSVTETVWLLCCKWLGCVCASANMTFQHGRTDSDRILSSFRSSACVCCCWGRQKINGAVCSLCILRLSQPFNPQKLIPFVKTRAQPTRMLQHTKINSRFP